MEVNIHTLFELSLIDRADLQFAASLQRIGNCDDDWVGVAMALVSRSAAEGHVCLDLAALQQQGRSSFDMEADLNFLAPPVDWQDRLRGCAAVGASGDYCPLILDGHRLYLHRFWTYEQELAKAITERSQGQAPAYDVTRLKELLTKLFPEGESRQRIAALQAATRLFSVISGGPGTGKTYTIAKIILLLLLLDEDQKLPIHLAAPTGKAAARLQEAVELLLSAIDPGSSKAKEKLQEARTIHRLLGYMPAAAKFRYHGEHPLLTRALIVDEASMIDLSLMRHLVQAIPPSARLILVGDKDQLASVEAGAVLGDICHGVSSSSEPKSSQEETSLADSVPTLKSSITILDRSYRFDPQSGIGALGKAINSGDGQMVLDLLADDGMPNIRLRPLNEWHALTAELAEEIANTVVPMMASRTPEKAFEHLKRFKILTAVRKGPFGVEAMNLMVEQILRRRGYISSSALWYQGRPVMITRNDYHHALFNGDVGVAFNQPLADSGQIQIAFSGSDQSIKWLAPHQLTDHQTVYAMTIHKSQGSEFDRVMIVLPAEDTPLLTRELIYTAVTRARQSIVIWAEPSLLSRAVQRPIQRASGLRDALWP
ncbi:MAG: exodeoxyribonuclease V subunit alpha [Desulfobacteraceae bacterium]|nr:exodeoxyribonuclease V subunit alpha [Desulfobacteraceae bacterium]